MAEDSVEKLKQAVNENQLESVEQLFTPLTRESLINNDEAAKRRLTLLVKGLEHVIMTFLSPNTTLLNDRRVAYYILCRFIEHSPLAFDRYLKVNKKAPESDIYKLFLYDAVHDTTTYTALGSKLRPLSAIWTAAFVAPLNLPQKQLFSVLSTLATRFTALGWNQAPQLPADEKQATTTLKQYLQSTYPQLSEDQFNQLPGYVLPGFVKAIQAGENERATITAERQTVLGKTLLESNLLIEDLIKIVASYAALPQVPKDEFKQDREDQNIPDTTPMAAGDETGVQNTPLSLNEALRQKGPYTPQSTSTRSGSSGFRSVATTDAKRTSHFTTHGSPPLTPTSDADEPPTSRQNSDSHLSLTSPSNSRSVTPDAKRISHPSTPLVSPRKRALNFNMLLDSPTAKPNSTQTPSLTPNSARLSFSINSSSTKPTRAAGNPPTKSDTFCSIL